MRTVRAHVLVVDVCVQLMAMSVVYGSLYCTDGPLTQPIKEGISENPMYEMSGLGVVTDPLRIRPLKNR